MKYRYEHLENYPGNESVPGDSNFSQQRKVSPQRKPSNRSIASHSQWQRATSTAEGCQYRSKKSSSTSQDHSRQQTRGKGYAIGANGFARDGHHTEGPHRHNQADPSVAQGRYDQDEYLQRQRPMPHLRAVASRSSLAASARYGNRSGGRRRYHSKSSLVSYMSSSPSVYKSIKPSRSYKRHVSFKHHNMRKMRDDGQKLTVRNNTDHGVWGDDGGREGLNREDSPKFEQPEAALPPRSRKEFASTAERRSTVVIDGHVLDGGYAGAAQSLRKKMSFLRDNEDAERRRMVSKELEEACERAFNSSDVRSSFTALGTVRGVGPTTSEFANTTDTRKFSDDFICSMPEHTQELNQSIYTETLDSTQITVHSDERSGCRNTLHTFSDEEGDPDKGCFDDIIQHFDRLMDSSAEPQSTGQLRAISQGGIPLNFGGALLNSRGAPTLVEQYHDQEEGGHQKYPTARAYLRNFSTPNPHRNSTINRNDPQGRALISTGAAPEPRPLEIQSKSALGKPADIMARSETETTFQAANDALRFDAPMPTPELSLPIAQKELQCGLRAVGDDSDGGNLDSKFIETGGFIPIKVANEPKKKRSFMEILTGKKATKPGKDNGKPGDGDNLRFPGVSANPPMDALNIEKGTFGRRSGKVLRRLVSRDAKRELGLQSDAKKEVGFGNGSNMALNSMLGRPILYPTLACFIDFLY